MKPHVYYILHLVAYLACVACIACSIRRPVCLLFAFTFALLGEFFYSLYSKS